MSELATGRAAGLSRGEPFFARPGTASGQPLADPYLSRKPLRFLPLQDGGVRLENSSKRTAITLDDEPLDAPVDLDTARLNRGAVLNLSRRIVLLLHRKPQFNLPLPPAFGLVGESSGLREVRRAIERVAPLLVPVLIRGQTGTGKELVARALHDNSPRRDRPFVSVNLGALAPSLATAELFGARKGAFTGAVRDQPGFFARADGGTLFLDEIGEATPEVQVMLLRALETHEILPIGHQTPRRVDVRVLAATDADLDRQIAAGHFRSPLFHRLSGYQIYVPPLAERREDLGRLLVHFLRREAEEFGMRLPPPDPDTQSPWLPARLMTSLALYGWPGNVRQLVNVARQLLIDSTGEPTLGDGSRLQTLLGSPDAPASALATTDDQELDDSTTPVVETPRRKPAQVSEAELLVALKENRWELKAAARALGIARTSLYDRMRRSPGIRTAADLSADEIRRAHERCGGHLVAMVEELEVSARALRQRLKDLGLH